jgi:hypothetical protein
MGDRRGQQRFDVSGQLWGALNVHTTVVLKDIATGGAMLEASLATGLKSLRTGQLTLRDRGPEVNVVIRHMVPVAADAGEDRLRIGVEFVNLSAAARADVEQVVRTWQQDAPAAE